MSEKILKALANPTRLEIVRLLKKGEICACKFVELIGKAQPTVSQHLRVLENAGIAKSRRDGKMIFYSLTNTKVFDIIKILQELKK